jgi:Transposase Tn5 dimerisation domain/Transposase DDE domain
VSDRESDIYEYLHECQTLAKYFVVRAYHNRFLAAESLADDSPRLLSTARAWEAPQDGQVYTVDVPANKDQPKRQAVIALQWGKLTLSSPSYVRPASTLTITVVRAWEPDPPSGAEAVEWILLTSWPISNWADARQVVDWYECRWLIEDYHQCLKTGCRIEASQLDQAHDLQRLLGFATPIALRLLQLRQTARGAPDQLAAATIEPIVLQILARRFQHTATEITLAQFWLDVAHLGGYLGRKRDGPPGWRTLWKGWRLLSDWADGARLATS